MEGISQGEKGSEDLWLRHRTVTEAARWYGGIHKREKLGTAAEAANHRWVLYHYHKTPRLRGTQRARYQLLWAAIAAPIEALLSPQEKSHAVLEGTENPQMIAGKLLTTTSLHADLFFVLQQIRSFSATGGFCIKGEVWGCLWLIWLWEHRAVVQDTWEKPPTTGCWTIAGLCCPFHPPPA